MVSLKLTVKHQDRISKSLHWILLTGVQLCCSTAKRPLVIPSNKSLHQTNTHWMGLLQLLKQRNLTSHWRHTTCIPKARRVLSIFSTFAGQMKILQVYIVSCVCSSDVAELSSCGFAFGPFWSSTEMPDCAINLANQATCGQRCARWGSVEETIAQAHCIQYCQQGRQMIQTRMLWQRQSVRERRSVVWRLQSCTLILTQAHIPKMLGGW